MSPPGKFGHGSKRKQDTMKTPYPPIDKRPLPDKIGAGMDRFAFQDTGNTVTHTMVGSLWGTDAWFRRADVAAATHYGIGGRLDPDHDGYIIEWIGPDRDVAPWASGPWRGGEGDGPAYVRAFGVEGINGAARSIETSGQVATPMTMKQWRSLIWLIAAIEHDTGHDSEHRAWRMEHWEFCTRAYKACAFPRITNYTAEYHNGINQIMRHYEGLEAPESVKIAGLTIPLPLGLTGASGPSTPSQGPIFEAFETPRRATLRAATGRQYGNTQAKILHTYKPGTRVKFVGFYHGQMVGGSDRWYVVDEAAHARVHESGIEAWG